MFSQHCGPRPTGFGLQLGNGWVPRCYGTLTVPVRPSVMCGTCSFVFDPGGILIRQGDPHMTSPRIPQNFERPLARRGLLKGMGAAAAFATVPGALAACSSSKSSGSSSSNAGSATAPVTFGSNYSDPGAEGRVRGADRRRHRVDQGRRSTINTVDHNTFQSNITSYLQGTPDDLFTWFAGYRMQYFAAQGLAQPHRRRLGEDRRQLQRRRQEAVHRPGRPPVPGADLQLPVGGLLQQERLRGTRATPSRPPGTTTWRWPRR